MATHLFEHRAALPRSRAAWLASIAVHGSLLAALGYISWTTLQRGSRGERNAEPSIVLALGDGPGEEAAGEQAEGPGTVGTGPAAAASAEGHAPLWDEAALHPQPLATDAAGTLAPAPRMPRLGLGPGLGRGASSAAPPTPSAASPGAAAGAGAAGPLRLGAIADRATVMVFGARGEGTRFVYLFDHSTSMEGAPLAAAKQQLIASLDALESTHQFQIIFFNHDVQAWDLTAGQRRVPFASDANKRLAAHFVRSVIAAGGTDRVAPLRRALAASPDVVFFLTDADDAMAEYDLAETIDRAQRSGTAIACIEFGVGAAGASANFLTRLAAATGGDYVYVDTTRLGR